jgi:cyclase
MWNAMQIEQLGERNITVIHERPFRTTTHLILGEKRVYVCDTFLGPEPMKEVSKVLRDRGASEKPIVVFNSHSDWDHIWGNCYFENSFIIGHMENPRRLLREGEKDLEEYGENRQGEVILRPPNMLFEKSLSFADDHVEFFYSPGHTIDSASCYDHIDQVLFVGDNVESEIPHVNRLNLDTYVLTLVGYLKRKWNVLVAGHDPVQRDNALVKNNIEYLAQFRDWELDLRSLSESALGLHLHALGKLVDEVISSSQLDEARIHYQQAIDMVKGMKQSDTTREYARQFNRVVKQPER